MAPRPASMHTLLAPLASIVLILLVVAGLLVRPGTAEAQTSGGFAGATVFSANGQAATVFFGGTVDQLESAARTTGATGVWVQDSTGRFELLIVGGPAFLREAFTSRFPTGFTSAIAVTLTRPAGATSPPPIVTSTPGPSASATPVPPSSMPTGIPGPSTNE